MQTENEQSKPEEIIPKENNDFFLIILHCSPILCVHEYQFTEEGGGGS